MAEILYQSMYNRYQNFLDQFNKRRQLHQLCKHYDETYHSHVLREACCLHNKNIPSPKCSNHHFIDDGASLIPIENDKNSLGTKSSLDNSVTRFPQIRSSVQRDLHIIQNFPRESQDMKGVQLTKTNNKVTFEGIKNKAKTPSLGVNPFEHWLLYGNEDEKIPEDGGYALLGRIDKIYDDIGGHKVKTLESPEQGTSSIHQCAPHPMYRLTKRQQMDHMYMPDIIRKRINGSRNECHLSKGKGQLRKNNCIRKEKYLRDDDNKRPEERSHYKDEQNQSLCDKYILDRKHLLGRTRDGRSNAENLNHKTERNRGPQIYFYNGLSISQKQRTKHPFRSQENSTDVDKSSEVTTTSTTTIDPNTPDLTVIEDFQHEDPSVDSKKTYTIVIPCCTYDADDEGSDSDNVLNKERRILNEKNDILSMERGLIKETETIRCKYSSTNKLTREGNPMQPKATFVLPLYKLDHDIFEAPTERCSFWLAKQCPS